MNQSPEDLIADMTGDGAVFVRVIMQQDGKYAKERLMLIQAQAFETPSLMQFYKNDLFDSIEEFQKED